MKKVTFQGGVHPSDQKQFSRDIPFTVYEPKGDLVFPVSQHIGAPAVPVVKKGDEVLAGQIIAEAGGFVSAHIISSCSGKVKSIEKRMNATGTKVQSIVIENDGEFRTVEGIGTEVDYKTLTKEEILAKIKDAGIVGLGGAGFPTHVKLAPKNADAIEYIIANGAECEPYITSDTYTMTARVPDMEYALAKIKEHFGFKKIIIGIEENKKKAISAMKELASKIDGAEVKVLPSVYPQGGEKVIIYHTTKKVVPEGKLPIDVGCIVVNCTTIAAIGEYLRDGTPLVEKCITVDGGAVKTPMNVIAPIGASIADVIEFCGGLSEEPAKVLYGGPMMGIAVADINVPVLKNTNAVLALTEKEAKLPKTTACIRCGSCTNTCPFGLAAAEILLAYDKKDTEKLKKLSVMSCMECGCCSFVCPANRPLVQTNKLAKALLREEQAKEASKNG